MKTINLKSKAVMVIMFLLAIFLTLPIIELQIAFLNSPNPNGILTLGGSPDREKFTFIFAKQHPNIPIWISSGSSPQYVCKLYAEAEIQNPLVLDYYAVDTVTNFTSLVKQLHSQGINHVYLVTSEAHMPRAQAIATIVLGSQSIAFTPISSSNITTTRESKWRTIRDVLRAYLWIIWGKSGSSLKKQFYSREFYRSFQNCPIMVEGRAVTKNQPYY